MSQKQAIVVMCVLLAGVVGLTIFLVRERAPRDNESEYEQVFRPLTEEDVSLLVDQTSTMSESKLTQDEEQAIVASTSAQTTGSTLSEDEERALIEAMTAPAN